MAVLTLAQWAQLSKQPLVKGVMQGIFQEGVIADILPWRSTNGRLAETGVRFDEVISPDWVSLGGSITSGTANAKPISFGVNSMMKHIDIPIILDEANTDQLERSMVAQVRQATKGMAYELNDAFINGDPASNANQFAGINRLIAQMDSTQTVGSTQIDATGTYTDALAESWFSRIDRCIWRLDGHSKPGGVCFFANCDFLTTTESLARQYKLYGDHFNWGEYAYQIDDPRASNVTASRSPAFHYRKIPFYDLGVKADQTTKVILSTYTEGGATSSGTRLFGVRYGDDEFEGLQLAPLEVVDIGPLEGTDVRRKRIKWTVGVAAWNPRCLVKGQGFTPNVL